MVEESDTVILVSIYVHVQWRSVPTAYGLELELELRCGRGYREYGRPTWDRMPEGTNVGIRVIASAFRHWMEMAGVWTWDQSARSPHSQRGPDMEA